MNINNLPNTKYGNKYIESIIALRREGKTADEITKATGLSYYHQRQIYDRYNIPAPKAFLVIGLGYLAVEWFAEALSHAMGAGR